MLNLDRFVNRLLLNCSLVTSLTCAIVTTLPSKTLAITAFLGNYATSNWTLTNTNADGNVDTTNAAIGSIDLTGGNNGSSSSGTTDWIININATNAGTVSFDWSYGSLDTPGDDTAGYLLNSVFTQLATTDGQSSTSPVTIVLNSGDNFGFRVSTLSNNGGAGIFTVNNFDVQPPTVGVPFEFSPTLGLIMSGVIFGGTYIIKRFRKKGNKK